jgi:hypothetical protein
MTSSAYAACNSTTPCELPATNNSAASWTASASGMTGIQCLDSVGPNGNQANSRYFFAATTSNFGSTVANGSISTTGDGTQEIGDFALNSGSTPGSTVTGGVVQQLLGGQTYYFYAQACPSGATLDSTNCSQWAQIGSKSSLAYPASVFVAPTKPTDATVNTIAARTTVPAADINNISQIQLEVDNLITGGLNQTGIDITWPGANQANIVNSSMYTEGGGFLPNTKYQYKGQVFYPYGVAVPAAAQTEGPFWTTPVNPFNVVTSNITHCSVQITADNSNGTPANPTFTTYQLCATGTDGSCLSGAIGTASPTTTISETIAGLTPGTSYTPNAQALVGNGDGSQTGWNSSTIVNGTAFMTAGTAGTFTISAITTTGGTFNFPGGFDVSGATSWQVLLNGAATGPSGSGLPPASIPLTLSGGALNSNTPYTVQIKITEASCSYTVPQPGVQFYTLPTAPTAGSFGAITATTIVVNWTDGSTNPIGTTYHLQYSSNGGTTWTDFGTNPTKVAGSAQTTTITGLTPETTYVVQVKTVSASGGSDPDSAYFPIPGTATTLAELTQVASISPNPVNQVTATLSVQVDGSNTAPGITSYSWAITTPNGVPALANNDICQSVNGTASGNSCVVTFHQIGTGYSATVTITDSLSRTVTSNVNFNVVPVPQSVTVLPVTSTVTQEGAAVQLTANAIDQFGNAISPVTGVTWTEPRGLGSNGFATSGSTATFTPSGNAGTYTFHASVLMNGVTQADTTDATITVLQTAGSVVISSPTSGSLNQTQTFTYTAYVYDTSGVRISTPTVGWSFVGSAGLVPAPDQVNTLTNPGFDSNGNATIRFTANNPGFYTIQATATFNGGGATGTTSIEVNVLASSIAITPSPETLITGSPAQTFTATVKDPSGIVISNAQVTWSGSITDGGTLSTTGPSASTNFTATVPGIYTLTASSITVMGNTVTANDTVTVLAAGPQFNSLTFTMSQTDKGGTATAASHDNATSQWTDVWSASNAGVTFTPPSASSSPVTTAVVFPSAGQFTLTDTITDSYNVAASSSIVVTVPQVLSSIKVCPVGTNTCPASITVQTLQTQQFTATGLDQFGNTMPVSNVVWTSNGGNVNGAGAFDSPTIGQDIVVTATTAGKSGSITVNTISFDVSGAHAYPVPYKANQGSGFIYFANLGTQASIHIYTASGRRVFDTEVTNCADQSKCFQWDIKNTSGENIASGVYFYVIQSSQGKKDGKLIIIK